MSGLPSLLGVLGRLHHEGDVAGALVDPGGPALGPRAPAFHRRALVDQRLAHHEGGPVEVLGGLGVRDGALEDLVDGLAGGLRCELQQRQRLVDLETTDHVDDTAGLHRGAPEEACAGDRTRLVAEKRVTAVADAPTLGNSHSSTSPCNPASTATA